MTLDGLLGDGTDRPALPLQHWGLRSASSCFASQRWLGELWAEVSRLGTLVSFPGIEVFQGGFEKSASSREIVVSHDRPRWLPRCPPGRGSRRGAYQSAVTPFSWGSHLPEASSRPKEMRQTSAELASLWEEEEDVTFFCRSGNDCNTGTPRGV